MCTQTAEVMLNDPLPMTASIINPIDPDCAGSNTGLATVSPLGGDGNYSYTWSPTGGSNATGTGLLGDIEYTVVVTDGTGCTASASVTLTDPLGMTISLVSAINPTCDGFDDGEATLVVVAATVCWAGGG